MKLFSTLLFLLTTYSLFGQPGSLDTTFNAEIMSRFGNGRGALGYVESMIQLPGGKVVLGGSFSWNGYGSYYRVIRINPDGSPDSTFHFVSGDGTSTAKVLVPLSSGKYLVGSNPLMLIDTSGIPDSNFAENQFGNYQSNQATLFSILELPDQSILIAGEFSTHNGATANHIVKLLANGDIDPSFNTGTGFNQDVAKLLLLPDGRIMVSGSFNNYNGNPVSNIIILEQDGTLSADFPTNMSPAGSTGTALAVDSQGGILIAGNFTSYSGVQTGSIVRVNTAGDLDTTFSSEIFEDTIISFEFGIYNISFRNDGKLLVNGCFNKVGSADINCIALLNPDGSTDNSFSPEIPTASYRFITCISADDQQNIYASGDISTNQPTYESPFFAKFGPTGIRDTLFLPTVGADGPVNKVANVEGSMQLIGGNFKRYNGIGLPFLAKIDENGLPDPDFHFNSQGLTGVNDIVFLNDGNYAIVGQFGPDSCILLKISPDGSPVAGFLPYVDESANLRKVVEEPTGNLLVVSKYLPEVKRLSAIGVVDNQFAFPGNQGNQINKLVVQPDGRILIAYPHFLKRYMADGSQDQSFQQVTANTSATHLDSIFSICLLNDGNFLIGGNFTGVFGYTTAVAKIGYYGDYQVGFQSTLVNMGKIREIIEEIDGKFIVGGHGGVCRILANGTLDPDFHVSNVQSGSAGWPYTSEDSGVSSVVIGQNGKILSNGYFFGVPPFGMNYPTDVMFKLNNDVSGGNPMNIVVTHSEDVSCSSTAHFTVETFHGIPPYTYSWDTNPVMNDSSVVFTNGGIYTCQVTDSMGYSTSLTIHVDGPHADALSNLNTNLAATSFVPGFAAEVFLNSYNQSCQPVSGQLVLVYDSLLNFQVSIPAPDSIQGDSLIWNFDQLIYDSAHIAPVILFSVSTTAAIGDSVKLQLLVTPLNGDADSTDNRKIYAFPIRSSFDPNTISVYPTGVCDDGYVESSQPLTYTVKFQNTGNSTAVNVEVDTQIDEDLDLNTMEVVGASHHLWTEISTANVAKFHFEGIYLADSTTNEPSSHGYVIYKILPKATADNYDAIENKADIYFDYNEAVSTNTVTNIILNENLDNYDCSLSVDEKQLMGIGVYPNPSTGKYTVTASYLDGSELIVTDIHGSVVLKQMPTADSSELDLTDLPAGVYLVSIAGRSQSNTARVIKL